MIEAGTVIDGRYEVLRRVGSGGMADVYLCEDRLLGRRVAVKVLHHRFAEDQEFVERFRREASSAAGLSHPNVVAIFDRGAWDHTFYIAMEYLPGRTLKEIVRAVGPLPPATAIDVALQICRAARFAHRRGVIHRDLKPHNVILDEEGRAKVTDFGIARAGASDMTLTGSIMGTAQYLSPEQAQGHAVTAGSDLYAIGVVLYELLVGRVPFDGETAVTIALQHISNAPPPPSAANPAVPPQLDAIVLRAMEKDPAARYASAEQLIAELEAVRATLPEPPGEHVLAADAGALALMQASAADAQAAQAAGGGPPPVPFDPAAVQAAQPGPAQLPPPVEPPGAYGNGDASIPGHSTGSLVAVARGQGNGDGRSDGERRGSRWRRWALRWGLPLLAALLLGALVVLLLPSGTVTVPDVTGKTQTTAAAMLRKAGLKVVPEPASSAHVLKGHVVSETPEAGASVRRHTAVTIVVSTGRPIAVVPEVAGLPVEEAIKSLVNVGLRTERKVRSSSTFKTGMVIRTEPPAGERIPGGTVVTLLVSTGPARVKVPDVRGDSRAQAEAALERAKLAVGDIRHRKSAKPAGTVLEQEPGANARRPPGSSVELILAGSGGGEASSPARKVEVPSVLGEPQQAAVQAIRHASLTPEVLPRTVSNASLVGEVVSQHPLAGSSVERHSAVKLYVGAPASTSTTTDRTTTSATSTQSSTQSTTTSSTAAAPGVK